MASPEQELEPEQQIAAPLLHPIQPESQCGTKPFCEQEAKIPLELFPQTASPPLDEPPEEPPLEDPPDEPPEEPPLEDPPDEPPEEEEDGTGQLEGSGLTLIENTF